MAFSLLDLLIFISLGQGLIFGALLLRSPHFAATPTRYLGYSLIMVAIIGMNEWLSGWGFDDQYYFIDFFGDDVPWILLLYVPVFLYFLKTTRHPWNRYPLLPVLSLPFFLFLFLNVFIDLSVDFHFYALLGQEQFMQAVYTAEFTLAAVYVLGLCLATYFVVYRPGYPAVRRPLRQIYWSTAVLVLLWAAADLLPLGSNTVRLRLGYLLWSGIAGFIYWLIYQALVSMEWPGREAAASPVFTLAPAQRTTNNSVPAQRAEAYLMALEELMTEERAFLDPDLSRNKVAARLGISPGYLSQVLSEHAGIRFTDYINRHRIEAVKMMLRHPDFQSYSLLAIGEEAGFRSKSAFYTTFKKETGLTPNAWRNSADFSDSDN